MADDGLYYKITSSSESFFFYWLALILSVLTSKMAGEHKYHRSYACFEGLG